VNGDLESHQPRAKILSVCTTLLIIVLLEVFTGGEDETESVDTSPSSSWSRMSVQTQAEQRQSSKPFTYRVISYICIPYCVSFGAIASILQFNSAVALTDEPLSSPSTNDPHWQIVGYFLFALIESFGSIAVACFWSFCNSILSVEEAERLYGTIIGIAQLGAISGSTMVTMGVWSTVTLMVLSCLVILLHVVVMEVYVRRYPIRSTLEERLEPDCNCDQPPRSIWAGIHEILRNNYVIYILGASCLYEISLTCLNYQMTLLGWSRFQNSTSRISFKQFMGHYGQLVNVTSLLLSWLVFPRLMRKVGLRTTILLFPGLLMFVNSIAFFAIPGNLAVLFVSLALLKAMTYSVHDPSKEILYIPTSTTIKQKSKFWIDVVGARIAKAIGSAINRYAGGVERSIRISSIPSFCTATLLWWVCYRVGHDFDFLVSNDELVGRKGVR